MSQSLHGRLSGRRRGRSGAACGSGCPRRRWPRATPGSARRAGGADPDPPAEGHALGAGAEVRTATGCPRLTWRVQRGRWRSDRLGARHLRPTRRPVPTGRSRSRSNAASESRKRKAVPCGDLEPAPRHPQAPDRRRVLSGAGRCGWRRRGRDGEVLGRGGVVGCRSCVARNPIPRPANTAQIRSRSPKPRFTSACRIALRMSRKLGSAGASRRPSVISARAAVHARPPLRARRSGPRAGPTASRTQISPSACTSGRCPRRGRSRRRCSRPGPAEGRAGTGGAPPPTGQSNGCVRSASCSYLPARSSPGAAVSGSNPCAISRSSAYQSAKPSSIAPDWGPFERGQPGGVGDQPVGQAVRVLVVDDQRVVGGVDVGRRRSGRSRSWTTGRAASPVACRPARG